VGQGFYTAYVWGILPSEDIAELLDSDEIDDLRVSLNLKSQYESKVRWLGIFVADNDGNLYEERNSSGSWSSISHIINYTAFRASDIEIYLREAALVPFLDAEQKWAEFAAEFERITNTKLPNPTLLVVHDYD
jgi:hypothetical protein